MWPQVIIATLTGLVCGFWLAMEIGRVIYNRRMDELRGKVDRMRDLL
jgi:uncharacterized membrane protein YdjX (TVP38/TMEM64 family)